MLIRRIRWVSLSGHGHLGCAVLRVKGETRTYKVAKNTKKKCAMPFFALLANFALNLLFSLGVNVTHLGGSNTHAQGKRGA